MKKIISILLAVLLLGSSTGITYAQHFCGEFEMLSKVTLGETHLSCGMAMEASGCEDNDSETHHCCDTQYTAVSIDDNFTKANYDVGFYQTLAIVSFASFILENVVSYETSVDNYNLYHPPPSYKNITVLYETFLI
jgi:hypothetical protein